MRSETVTLGERQYLLEELPLRKAKAYRDRLNTQFGDIISLIDGAPNVDLTNRVQMVGLLRTVGDTLFNSIDTATEMLFDYSDAIRADRAYIEDNAYGSQVVDAFLAVMGIVYPFFGNGRLKRLMELLTGSSAAPTTTN